MAGESARDYARRQREKAERHLRVAQNYERGAEGEAATAAELDALGHQGWVTFHDVRWPGRQRANIDHVVIGPGGVFVIDSKNWSGHLAVKDGVLLQDGRRREGAVVAAAEAALAITALLGEVPVTGVLCFVRDEHLEGWARDVMVCSTSTLASMLTSQAPTLDPTAVRRFAGRLRGSLTPAVESSDARYGGQRAPDSARASRPPLRPRRKSSGQRSRRLLVAVAVALAAMLVGGPLMQWLSTAAISGVTQAIVPAPEPIGSAITVPGTSDRPQLRVTASRIVNARPVRGRESVVPRGQRLVAVDVLLENAGELPWRSASAGTAWLLRDSAGVAHSALRLRRVDVGRTLSPSLTVAGKGQVRGWVVFAIPARQSANEVDLSVGPGVPGSARWQVKP